MYQVSIVDNKIFTSDICVGLKIIVTNARANCPFADAVINNCSLTYQSRYKDYCVLRECTSFALLNFSRVIGDNYFPLAGVRFFVRLVLGGRMSVHFIDSCHLFQHKELLMQVHSFSCISNTTQ